MLKKILRNHLIMKWQILFEKDHIQANNITNFRFHEAQGNINAFVY